MAFQPLSCGKLKIRLLNVFKRTQKLVYNGFAFCNYKKTTAITYLQKHAPISISFSLFVLIFVMRQQSFVSSSEIQYVETFLLQRFVVR